MHRSTLDSPAPIPPLENGDHLTRAEFERRWDNMPELKKAELLNGRVFMSPAVSASHHGIPHSHLIFWLVTYRALTPGVIVADNSTLRLPPDDDAQPDAMLLIDPALGGRASFDDRGYVHGVPELVAEVAASSASYDLNLKLEIYGHAGIPEYVVWRTIDRTIDWFVLREGRYDLIRPEVNGVYHSLLYPGLWLDPDALIRGDLSAVMDLVQRGAAIQEHAEFMRRLGHAAER